MVNAYYHPMLNEIVFPAAILQPPFFDRDADDALNFGAMGAVVGHEMTHGYDDKGRKFDASGNLTNWWTEADGEEFTRRAAVMVAQANAFVVHTGKGEECGAAGGPFKIAGGIASVCACKNVNGALTNGCARGGACCSHSQRLVYRILFAAPICVSVLCWTVGAFREDLADLGGLKLAFAAFKAASGGAKEAADKDGFTPSQRFFLGYAQARLRLARRRREARRVCAYESATGTSAD